MLDTEPTGAESTGAGNTSTTTTTETTDTGQARPRRRRAATRPAGPPEPATEAPATDASAQSPAEAAPAEKPKRRRTTKKAAAAATAEPAADATAGSGDTATAEPAAATAAEEPAKPARRTRKKAAAAPPPSEQEQAPAEAPPAPAAAATPTFQPPGLLFQAPDPVETKKAPRAEETATTEGDDEEETGEPGSGRRRRRGGRGRRGRGRSGHGEGDEPAEETSQAAETAAEGETEAEAEQEAGEAETDEGGSTRRRRRRRRRGNGEDAEPGPDDPPNTVVRVREPRKSTRAKGDDDTVRSVKGSTRLEAKKQRRREGREAGRRRPSIITEAEFLARRESVERVMVVRQSGERTQIAVLEDGVLAEHYVASASSGGLVGNVYLGKVQNVLPSMEAAFVDIGKGRNAVLYAGEVNWDAAGLDGQPKRIEQALKSGDSVLVQVTKDPIGHKGARLTSQVSLAGRYLVYVPSGSMTGISRKLPDTERTRLKAILKKVVPDEAGVIVRTAAEGASEDELARDVARLSAQWEDIEKKAKTASAPALLYGEPDLTIRVVRDIFNEDFAKLIVSGDDAWEMLDAYVGHVAPDLHDRLSRWTAEDDVFAAHRIDEQLAKAMDRKVWLPSGGYLVIDRTEAMIVVDVNTGKFTGQGGNLEETVTKNNIEAAEEIVRQLRLRDLGGIIVIDFIDMVLESNRDLVLRRLLECLGRDRTKHQVAEVTSLGLVQMTRKRVGQGLFEAFSETCECCNGRGVHIRTEPVEGKGGGSSGTSERKGSRGGKAGSRGQRGAGSKGEAKPETTPETTAEDAPAPAVEDVVEQSPVAVEDPVEPPTLGDEPVEETPAPTRRRRRKATSPQTSPSGPSTQA